MKKKGSQLRKEVLAIAILWLTHQWHFREKQSRFRYYSENEKLPPLFRQNA